MFTVDQVNTEKPKQILLTAKRLRRQKTERGILYKVIRSIIGVSQADMAKLVGCSRDCIVQRERNKRLYTIDELLYLKRISGLSDEDWCEMLIEITK